MSMSNTARISFNLNYQGRQPNFTRDQVESMSDLLSIPIIDDGHITYVKSVKKHYVYDSNNTLMSGLGKWRELAFTEVLSVLGINDVGDVADKDYPEHSLVVHNRVLYHINALWEEGDSWNAADVSETSILDEINALRGVSTESVVLTITPASVIPVDGVKASIYNQTSDSYSEEVTFTSEHNTHTLAEVNYGDIYTILMPSIDGYTQPADQTFKAGQMIREREVTYTSAQTNIEDIRIFSSCSDGSTVPTSAATIRLLDGSGSVVETRTIDITGGTSQVTSIPYGTKYTVTFSDISGYLTPMSLKCTASASFRRIAARYVYLPGSDNRWVIVDNGDVEYRALDADLSDVAGTDKLFGVTFETSTLLSNSGAFIYVLKNNISAPFQNNLPWTSSTWNITAAAHDYNGESNTKNILDSISQYEEDNGVTVSSIFKACDSLDSGIVVGDTPVKFFITAWYQGKAITAKYNELNNILTYWGHNYTVVNEIPNQQIYSQQISVTQCLRLYVNAKNGENKTTLNVPHTRVLPFITTTSTTE